MIGDDACDSDENLRDKEGNINIEWSRGCYGTYGVIAAFRDFITKYNLEGKIEAGNQYLIKK